MLVPIHPTSFLPRKRGRNEVGCILRKLSREQIVACFHAR